jgi:hypothetical protein
VDQIQKFIADSSNSVSERGHLLHVLGEAKTKESLDILIYAATTLPEEGLTEGASDEIQSAGELRGDGKFHEELSPALERVWRESQDRYLLFKVGIAMGRVGAPSGIQLLLSAALAERPQSDIKKQAAEAGLADVLNEHAVPILAALLVNQPPTSAAGKLASGTLAAMSDPAAAPALLSWLQTTDASAAPLVPNYIVRTNSPEMLKACEAALNPAVPFRSEQNREAIRAGLAEYKKMNP